MVPRPPFSSLFCDMRIEDLFPTRKQSPTAPPTTPKERPLHPPRARANQDCQNRRSPPNQSLEDTYMMLTQGRTAISRSRIIKYDLASKDQKKKKETFNFPYRNIEIKLVYAKKYNNKEEEEEEEEEPECGGRGGGGDRNSFWRGGGGEIQA